jgi:murein DD-endopeptidase MepM/ murein hydrolase activator NlpD
MDWHLLAWPTDYRVVTQAFGARPRYYKQFGLPGHEGIDIRAPMGTPIYAVAPGTVYSVTNLRGDGRESEWGWHVRIQHDCGYKTISAHLANDEHLPDIEQTIIAGQRIGTSGNSGNSQIAHLHWTLKHEDGQAGWPYSIIDPTPFVERFLEGA